MEFFREQSFNNQFIYLVIILDFLTPLMFRPFGSVLVELERIPDTSEPSNISSR